MIWHIQNIYKTCLVMNTKLLMVASEAKIL